MRLRIGILCRRRPVEPDQDRRSRRRQRGGRVERLLSAVEDGSRLERLRQRHRALDLDLRSGRQQDRRAVLDHLGQRPQRSIVLGPAQAQWIRFVAAVGGEEVASVEEELAQVGLGSHQRAGESAPGGTARARVEPQCYALRHHGGAAAVGVRAAGQVHQRGLSRDDAFTRRHRRRREPGAAPLVEAARVEEVRRAQPGSGGGAILGAVRDRRVVAGRRRRHQQRQRRETVDQAGIDRERRALDDPGAGGRLDVDADRGDEAAIDHDRAAIERLPRDRDQSRAADGERRADVGTIDRASPRRCQREQRRDRHR